MSPKGAQTTPTPHETLGMMRVPLQHRHSHAIQTRALVTTKWSAASGTRGTRLSDIQDQEFRRKLKERIQKDPVKTEKPKPKPPPPSEQPSEDKVRRWTTRQLKEFITLYGVPYRPAAAASTRHWEGGLGASHLRLLTEEGGDCLTRGGGCLTRGGGGCLTRGGGHYGVIPTPQAVGCESQRVE